MIEIIEGNVKFYRPDKGFGVVAGRNGHDAMLFRQAVQGIEEQLKEGAVITVEVMPGKPGKSAGYVATRVINVDASQCTAPPPKLRGPKWERAVIGRFFDDDDPAMRYGFVALDSQEQAFVHSTKLEAAGYIPNSRYLIGETIVVTVAPSPKGLRVTKVRNAKDVS
jgi:cold shock CspA family protein